MQCINLFYTLVILLSQQSFVTCMSELVTQDTSDRYYLHDFISGQLLSNFEDNDVIYLNLNRLIYNDFRSGLDDVDLNESIKNTSKTIIIFYDDLVSSSSMKDSFEVIKKNNQADLYSWIFNQISKVGAYSQPRELPAKDFNTNSQNASGNKKNYFQGWLKKVLFSYEYNSVFFIVYDLVSYDHWLANSGMNVSIFFSVTSNIVFLPRSILVNCLIYEVFNKNLDVGIENPNHRFANRVHTNDFKNLVKIGAKLMRNNKDKLQKAICDKTFEIVFDDFFEQVVAISSKIKDRATDLEARASIGKNASDKIGNSGWYPEKIRVYSQAIAENADLK